MIISLPNDNNGVLTHVVDLNGNTVHAYRSYSAAFNSMVGDQRLFQKEEKTGRWIGCAPYPDTEDNTFRESFMKPVILKGKFFRVETDIGTEIVPGYLIDRTMSTDVSALVEYLEGTPVDEDATVECEEGFVARMSASGYMDCTDWTAHKTQHEAMQYLVDTFGDEEF